MAIRSGFLPAAPGWVRWPLYLLAFAACYGVVVLIVGGIFHEYWPRDFGLLRTVTIVLGLGMLKTWFGNHAADIPPLPENERKPPIQVQLTADRTEIQPEPTQIDRFMVWLVISVAAITVLGLIGTVIYRIANGF